MINNNLNYNTNSLAVKLAYSAYNVNLPSAEYAENDRKISAIKTRSTEKTNYANSVYFREGLNNEYVNVGLSNENLQRLKENFGSANIQKDSEGKFILKGEAEKFLSAWFNDIAYKRGYLKADTNNDGFLNLKEKYNTNAFFGSSIMQIANTIFASDYRNYAKKSAFANADEPIGSRVLNSIEEELNKTLEFDKDMDGRIYVGDMASSKDILNFFKKIMNHNTQPQNEWNRSGLPSPKIVFFFLTKTMKDLKKILEELLKKYLEQAVNSGILEPRASTQELVESIVSKENGTQILNNIKDLLENEQSQRALNSNQIQEKTLLTLIFDKDQELFNTIAKLIKLDEKTLYNLKNNPNFEQELIFIVQELTQNRDNFFKNSAKLDIKV